MEQIINTIKLLRFPFSVFLLPVSLFSFYFIQTQNASAILLVLFVWHFLVFPSSNGYNSYNDRDEGPIGGLKAPPKPTRQLLMLCNLFDVSAVLLALLLAPVFALFVATYIVSSRLYSSRTIRLKKYPLGGFLVVFIFQGAWVFCANFFAFNSASLIFSNSQIIFSALTCSFFIGTLYPITQIDQHKADKADGVTTLSMVLGYRGTFFFSATMFLLANLCIYFVFRGTNDVSKFWLFNAVM
ncbi:MAG: UbiA prenyltransferase family protein, partial [Bacteroidetes bacterium]|nr:UbiA prenyltransferase family protein [Bacteroidota bacterium]